MLKAYKINLILAILLVVTCLVLAVDENQQLFIKIFNDLHREPGPQQKTQEKSFEYSWIEQKLDHFNNSETRTWQMRYIDNDEFYKPGGPLFIFVGGEWFISNRAIGYGTHIYDMAREHDGYLFYTEHRFYGESRPLEDMSTENLQYLTVQQALADLAHFIRTQKTTINGMNNSKTILVGASYSATIATWFKKLYPKLADGVWASSAPLFAMANFLEYKEIMGESIKLVGGYTCHDRIERAFSEFEFMFANKRGDEVKTMLKLCHNFREEDDMDLSTLFYEISDLFASLIQKHNAGDIENDCLKIMEGSTDVIGLTNFILEKFNTQNCKDLSYNTYLNALRNITFSRNIIRPWTYQTCYQLGWFQTSTSLNQPFGTKYPLTFFISTCTDLFGEQFTDELIEKRLRETNEIFGGLNPEVENVYWTHGQLDPWRGAGIQNTTLATIIPCLAHCKDLKSISPKDSAELKASKEAIAKLVTKWLA